MIGRLKREAAIAMRKARQRLPDSPSQHENLEQLAHLGRADEFLRAGGERGVGLRAVRLVRFEQLREAAIEEELRLIDEWCTGFIKGTSLDMPGWLPITVGHSDWLSTVPLYGTGEGREELEREVRAAPAVGLTPPGQQPRHARH